jgi:hypothetical protein
MLMSFNLRGSIWGAARWLGHRERDDELPWVVDQRDGGRWVEYGRYASKQEAESFVRRFVANGRGEASGYRVQARPIGTDRSAGVLWAIGIGLLASAILATVLFVTWR